jgi:tetratricopeptide (TPR) repeat protein
MSLLVAFLGTVSASAEELPEQIVGCIEVESNVIAKVGINCAILNISTFEPLSYFSTFAKKTEQRELEYTSYQGSKQECVDVIKLSSGQTIESEKVFECEIVFVDLDAVGLSLGKKGQLAFELFLEFYPTELYGDDAQFKLAELYDKRLKDTEKAKEAYESVIVKYPGSIYVVEARKRFRELRGDKINN